MAHQEHNIPWTLLSKNLKFVSNNRAYTPPCTGLFSRPSPTLANDLNHFVRCLISTIRTFADTERKKYPEKMSLGAKELGFVKEEGKVFRDELKARYPEFLDVGRYGAVQHIDDWTKCIHPPWNRTTGEALQPGPGRKGHYTTSEAPLVEVVKVLFYESVRAPSPEPSSTRTADREAAATTLLKLAAHPTIPLDSLRHLSWGHHFGWSRVMESALRVYVLFNTLIALGTTTGDKGLKGLLGCDDSEENAPYTEMEFYQWTFKEETMGMDYPAQQIPHSQFWNDCLRSSPPPKPNDREVYAPPMHRDMQKLKAYLKLNFALLYHYDMVVRECGGDPKWEEEICGLLNRMIKLGNDVKLDMGWDEKEQSYTGKWSFVQVA